MQVTKYSTDSSSPPLLLYFKQYPKPMYQAVLPQYNQEIEQAKLVEDNKTLATKCNQFYDELLHTVTDPLGELPQVIQQHIERVIIPEIHSFKNDLLQQEQFVILLGDTGTGKVKRRYILRSKLIT